MNVLIYAGVKESVPAEYRGAAEEAFVRRLEAVCRGYLTSSGLIPDAVVDTEVSLSLMSADEIAALNKEYRETNEATDVLSFPMWEAADGSFQPPSDWEVLPLGDIVVCPQVVAKNAAENGRSFEAETALVILHGLLHLTGHDHDTEERKAEMWKLQDAMVSSFLDESGGTTTHSIDEAAARGLIEAARAARERAYAPYSHFKVGAALLFRDGRVVSGCNVENASYGLSLCAERNAMTTAVTMGEEEPLAAAIVGERGECCPPCGACRQFLAEFGLDMDIILEDGDKMKFYKLRELLPADFSHSSMEKS